MFCIIVLCVSCSIVHLYFMQPPSPLGFLSLSIVFFFLIFSFSPAMKKGKKKKRPTMMITIMSSTRSKRNGLINWQRQQQRQQQHQQRRQWRRSWRDVRLKNGLNVNRFAPPPIRRPTKVSSLVPVTEDSVWTPTPNLASVLLLSNSYLNVEIILNCFDGGRRGRMFGRKWRM